MIAEIFLGCALALPPNKEQEFNNLCSYLLKFDPGHEYIFMETADGPTPKNLWRRVDIRYDGLYIWRRIRKSA